MRFDPIYALQRKTIARKMHAQVNKLYLHEHAHPYLKNLHELVPQYVYRIQTLLAMAEDAIRKNEFNKDLLHRALLEVASNPHAQVKLNYAELVDIKTICSDYANKRREPKELAQTIATCAQRLLPRIPDIMPCPESAARQTADMQEAVDWMLFTYEYNIQDIIRFTDEQYLSRIRNSHHNCVHPKVPYMSDYLININAVVYSSLRLLCRPKYAKEDTSIVYWCCMYLRYCAPGFLDVAKNNSDAYERTMKVLSILHHEWQYLLAKYK